MINADHQADSKSDSNHLPTSQSETAAHPLPDHTIAHVFVLSTIDRLVPGSEPVRECTHDRETWGVLAPVEAILLALAAASARQNLVVVPPVALHPVVPWL